MIFAVDIGNSNIVAGLLDEQRKVHFNGRIRTDRRKTREEFMIELKNLLDIYHISMQEINGVIISSVVPELTDVVKEGMALLTGKSPIVVGHGIKTGIQIATDQPSALGTDLVVDAVAAAEEYGESEGFPKVLAIFDMGTATTCSVVEDKTYLGTMIMPGIRISQEALTEKTSQLPYIRFEKPKHLIGKNTIESMQSGLIYGNAAMVDGLIERLEDTMGKEILAVATGGIAELIVPYCKRKILLDSDLLLKGLWYIFHKNVRESGT